MPSGIDNNKIIELYNNSEYQIIENILGFDIRNLLIDYNKKLSIKEITDKYKTSRSFIIAIAKLLNIYENRHGKNQYSISSESLNKLNDKNWMINNYVNQLRTAQQISKELSVSSDTVFNYLNKHNITLRDRSTNTKNYFQSKNKQGYKLLNDKNWMIEQYVNLKKSSDYIANKTGTSQGTVLSKLKEFNIEIRQSGTHQIKAVNVNGVLSKLNDKQWLIKEYDDKSTLEIAKNLGCTARLVQLYLKKHKITPKSNIYYQSIVKPSKVHLRFSTELTNLNINHKTSWIYTGRYNNKDRSFEIDEYLPDHKLFIEVQGEHWHGLDSRHWVHQRVRNKLWSDLIKYLCITRDYPDHKLCYISEHEIYNNDWQTKIFNNKNKDYNFDKSLAKIINDNELLIDFIKQNHYLHSIRNGRNYGLVYNDKLVYAINVCPPSRQKLVYSGKYPGEISRMVGVDAPLNSASFLLSKVVKCEKSIKQFDGLVTFADPSPVRKGEHNGSVYKSANFKYTGQCRWNYCYIDVGGEIYHKKTIYNMAENLSLTEKQFTIEAGLYKLPEWPKYRYEYLFK